MSTWQPTVIAHRGGAAGFGLAENSREAFAAASAEGFASECDVWLSADGEAVVMHDGTLDRTTLLSGRVTDLSASTLQQVYLRTATAPATVPLLREVASDVFLVEIKQDNARALVRRVIEIMDGKAWRLQSFDRANLLHAAELAPSVPVALLVYDQAGIDAAIAGNWPAYMDHRLLDGTIAKRLRDAGLPVGTWTVNTQQAFRRIAPFRPEVIITDVPRLIRSWLAQ